VTRFQGRYRLGKHVLLPLALVCGGSQWAVAQQIRPLPPESVLAARSFVEYSPIEFSPDGKRLAVTVRDPVREKGVARGLERVVRTGVPATAHGADIVVVGIADGRAISITGGKGNNWLPTWSPDGRFLAFLSNRDSEYAHLWLWEVESGNLRKVSDASVWTKQIQWLPASDGVLLGLLPERFTVDDFSNHILGSYNVESQKYAAGQSTVVVYRSNSSAARKTEESPLWNLDGDLRDLASIDIRSGKITRIDQGHRISAYFLSPDGSRIAYTSPQHFKGPGSQQILFDIVVVSVFSGESHILASTVQLEIGGGSLSWSPDSSRIAYRTGGMEGTGDCYVLDPKTTTPRNLTSFGERHAGYASQPPLWDARGEHIYFTDGNVLWRTTSWGQPGPVKIEIPGYRVVRLIENGRGVLWLASDNSRTVVLASNQGTKQLAFYEIELLSSRTTLLRTVGQNLATIAINLFGTVSSDGEQFAYFSQDAQHDMNIWLAQSDFRTVRQLTDINPTFDQYPMGAARLIEWRDLDGEPLQGALLLPPGYQKGQRYPVIVWVYGGDRGSDSISQFGFLPGPFNFQLLATRGYAVFFPDAPQHLGTPMVDLAKTVLPGIDKVVELGIGDPDRLGIMGQSNGGYSVLGLIVQTNRFKAALESDGMGDLMALYGEMNATGEAFGTSLERAVDALGGTPWEFRERYIENSPIFYLDRVETPLLIVHGERDEVVSEFLADELFVDMRRLGKEVEYAKYGGEGHSPPFWEYANQLEFCNRMIRWFTEHLANGKN